MLVLNERDFLVLNEVFRWRVCLGRHIKELAGFDGQRACDRRLKKLIEAGYLERKKVLYGIAGLYMLTHKGRVLINVSREAEKVRLEQIHHDIAVLDVAIFFKRSLVLTSSQITSEKELHMQDGFGNRAHRPDFLINSTICVEVELTPKSKTRTEKNIKDNYLKYDEQLWIVPNKTHKVAKLIDSFASTYPNIKIYELEKIKVIS